MKQALLGFSLLLGVAGTFAHDLEPPGEYRWNESRATGYRDTDQDGIRDYRDLCIRTAKGERVDYYGCPNAEGHARQEDECPGAHYSPGRHGAHGGVRSASATTTPGTNAVLRKHTKTPWMTGCGDHHQGSAEMQEKTQ